jgi:tRNA-dihydrouridine synthase B
MAGITDSAFRRMCKKYGADVVYSEMASVSALFFKPQKTLELVRFNQKERPYIVQLFGKDPAHFAKAAKIVTEKIKPDGIDINFGCPAKKVFGHGSGCALMPQKKLAREIISAVCENTDLPVSLKIRAGLKDMTALEFIKNTKDLPYLSVMIHGRTYEGGFSGPVDFSVCEKIKKIIPDKIVLANGGINSSEDAIKILQDYSLLDGLGIARGALGRPWIFEEIKNLLKNRRERKFAFLKKGTDISVPYNFNTIRKIMLQHAKLIYKDKGKLGIFEIRKHLCWYIKGFLGASELRRKLVLAESLEEIKKILKEYISKYVLTCVSNKK